MITKCRLCQSKNLGFALKLKGLVFIFCKDCTLLQRKEEMPYELNFNPEEKQLEVDYYPAFLSENELGCINESSVVLFSLKAIETLLNNNGFKITDVEMEDNKLYVAFAEFSSLEKLHFIEKRLKLNNQYSYFLWAVKLKKNL